MTYHSHDHPTSTKPRVQIRYEIESENGIQEKELPFVIGVIGDFAADNTELPPIKEREFINIDSNNFNEVMAQIKPSLKLHVADFLSHSDAQLPIQLCFSSIHDFEPEQLINQVEPLRKLKLARDRLRSLLNRTECSENLEQSLKNIIKDEALLLKLANEIQEFQDE